MYGKTPSYTREGGTSAHPSSSCSAPTLLSPLLTLYRCLSPIGSIPSPFRSLVAFFGREVASLTLTPFARAVTLTFAEALGKNVMLLPSAYRYFPSNRGTSPHDRSGRILTSRLPLFAHQWVGTDVSP